MDKKTLFDKLKTCIYDKKIFVEDIEGYCDVLTKLFQMGFKSNHLDVSGYYHQSLPLYDLLHSNNIPIRVEHLTNLIEYINDNSDDDSEHPDTDEMVLLTHLVKFGVPILKNNKDGESAMSLAIRYNLYKVLDILITHVCKGELYEKSA
jgi:ankyrin repeat protein